MAKYKDKWKTTFPAAIGNQTRPSNGVDNTQEYNTDGLPQYMANDPVRYDLQNAINSQLVSNDERLNEKIKHTSDDLAAHNKDPKAHATGISGNAATASKLATPRTLSLTGKAAGSTTFDGSANATINVTSVNADTATKATQDGAGKVITNTYLKKAGDTATGDLTAPNFIGHLKGNADTATKATQDSLGNIIIKTYATKTDLDAVSKKADIQADWDSTDSSSIAFIKNIPNSIKSINNSSNFRIKKFYKVDNHGYPTYRIIEELTNYHPTKRPTNWGTYGFSVIELCDIRNGNGYHQEPAFMYASLGYEYDMLQSTSSDDFPVVLHNTESDKYYVAIRTIGPSKGVNLIGTFNYPDIELGEEVLAQDDKGTLPSGWELTYKPKDMLHMNSLQAGRANDALKLTTKRLIKLTGDMTGDIYFDGSKDITVNTTVNESKHATTATALDTYVYRPSDANIQKGDGLVRHFIAASNMIKNKPPAGDGHILSFAWDNNGGYDAQLCVNNATGRINVRGQMNGKWSDWLTVLDSANFNSFAPTKTGTGASGTWGINISGNAASATNADTVDGYHASDLLRTLGGNRTPVITDIFDRAGTIDMSTMSAADKAKHKANINKAPNMIQNIWNDTCDIHAYGGDLDIAGYYRGTLKLTQSWKNFDKLMIVYSDDDGNWEEVRMFDVYEFNYCMKNLHSINLFSDYGVYLYVYGLTKHGTDASFIPSTETVLSCRKQNASLIGIYGIKF